MGHKAQGEKQFTGRHMLLTMACFFGVIISVNMALAVFATESWTGLLAKNGYVASQDYNKVLADARQQRQLGWTSALEVRAGAIGFTLRDANGRPIDGLEVSAHVSRPTDERHDRDITLTGRGGGRYTGAADLAPGVWSVDIMALAGGDRHYRQIFRITANKDG